MIISTAMLATGAIGGLAASRWRYETPTLRVGAPGDGDSASDDLPIDDVNGDVHGAASAEEPARRIALDRRIGFPVLLSADIVLVDNFFGDHDGVDMWRADEAPGHPLVACVDGVLVERSRNEGRPGNAWVLQAADGVRYRYHHLDEFEPGLEVGSVVQRGDVLGTMGSTGNAGGPHLHFEVRPTRAPVDPMDYLPPPPTGVYVR